MRLSHSIIFACCLMLSTDAFTTSPHFAKRRLVSMGAIKKAAETKTTTSTSVKKKRAAPKVAKKEVEAEPEVTVRKAEFITKMIEKTGMTKADAESALSAVIDTITEEVSSGKKVSMVGFGTFKLTKRAARKGRNPKTGEEIDIAASNSPSFSAGKSFKERCNM